MREMFGRQIRRFAFLIFLVCWLDPSRSDAQISRLPTINLKGAEFVRISDLGRAYGMKASATGRTVLLSVQPQGPSVRMEIDSREAFLNGVKVWFNAVPVVANGMILLPRMDAVKVLDPI